MTVSGLANRLRVPGRLSVGLLFMFSLFRIQAVPCTGVLSLNLVFLGEN
jgi:hypothetical protein